MLFHTMPSTPIVYTSKVVDPINKRYIKHDRRYLDLEHSKKYGFKIEDVY